MYVLPTQTRPLSTRMRSDLFVGPRHPDIPFNLVALELFNGKTNAFPKPQQKKDLRVVLNNNLGCEFAQEIVLARGYQPMFPFSHLAKECNFLQNQ